LAPALPLHSRVLHRRPDDNGAVQEDTVMKFESKTRTWVQSVATGFLCVTAAITFAVARGHPREQAATRSTSAYVPPGMHEAEAGVDVGPGSDEAELASSPQPE
jgi:hypothetical protein